MRFSIIVPIYKVESFLHKCIDSVLSQTYYDFELVLVDDGSPDNCPAICDSYALKDERIRVIHKPNGGLVSARKAGVEIALGKYSLALDGDDWLSEGCLQKLSSVIDDFSPEVIRFGYIYSEGENRTSRCIKGYRKGFYDRSQIDKEIMPSLIYGEDANSYPPSVWGCCFATSLYKEEQLAVPNEISIGEDFAVTKPIMVKASSVYIMDDCLYYYRANMVSMTKNRKPYNLRNYAYRCQHILNRIDVDKYGLRNQLYRSTVHGLFNAYATQFYQDKPYSDIKECILASMSEDLYKDVIEKVNFDKPLNRRLMAFALKHRLIRLIWLYSKIR